MKSIESDWFLNSSINYCLANTRKKKSCCSNQRGFVWLMNIGFSRDSILNISCRVSRFVFSPQIAVWLRIYWKSTSDKVRKEAIKAVKRRVCRTNVKVQQSCDTKKLRNGKSYRHKWSDNWELIEILSLAQSKLMLKRRYFPFKITGARDGNENFS